MSAPRQRSRQIWRHLETLHAVVYFDDEVTRALKGIGLKGFWMSYFAARAAPLGAVGPGPVEATFYNFAPSMVQRSIPDAWRFAEPVAVLGARSVAAAASLRRVVPNIDAEASRIVPLLSSAVRCARPDGRTLFAANQRLPLPDDPVAALWQCATTLREHRGDGHVALLVGEDISGVEAHQLAVAATGIPDDQLRGARGWSTDEWDAAKSSLIDRGLLTDEFALSAQGALLRNQIEERTDDLSWQPYSDGLTDAGIELLPSLLAPLSGAVVAAGVLPFPNPIGLADS